MPGLIGIKRGMTSVFDENGKNVPCTVIEAAPNTVTQVRSPEKDGYEALQLGYGDKKEKTTSKPLLGHFKKAGVAPKEKVVELQGFEEEKKAGDEVDMTIFEEGEFIDLTGISKGKGYQGVVKRYNFRGVGEDTHGQHGTKRAPGSIGGASDPSRVFPGLKMAGQTGGRKNTTQNLEVVKLMPEKNLIVVKGAVPGHKNAYVILHK
ncbi:MAG: 50S ribosomal protein L3 [Flavobacteriales bacterium]